MGELKEERRLYTNTFRLYRFVVNPKKAIIRELKKMGTDLAYRKGEVSGRSHPDMFQINRKELIQSLIQRSTYCLSAHLQKPMLTNLSSIVTYSWVLIQWFPSPIIFIYLTKQHKKQCLHLQSMNILRKNVSISSEI